MSSSSASVKQLLAILSLFLATGALCAQQDDPALRDRFLKGVLQTARKVEHLSFRAKCKHSSQMTSLSERLSKLYAERKIDPDKIDTTEFECAIRGPDSLQAGTNKIGNKFYKVRNGRYAFAIERSPVGERTSLQFVEQLGADPSVDAKIAEIETLVRASALGTVYFMSIPLSRLVASELVNIKKVYAIQLGSRELVRVEWDGVIHDANHQPDTTYSDCFLICDPSGEWALTEYGGTSYTHVNNSKGSFHVTLEFGDSVDGIPVAKKVEWKTSYLDDPGTSRLSVFTTEITSHDAPEVEFFLSHYGLPEPTFRRVWFGTWVWYLFAVIVCLGVSYVIVKRRRAVIG